MCHRAQARRRTAFEHNRYVGRPHLQDGAEFLTTPYSYMARLQIKYEIQTPS